MKVFKTEVNVPLETLQSMFGGEIQGKEVGVKEIVLMPGDVINIVLND